MIVNLRKCMYLCVPKYIPSTVILSFGQLYLWLNLTVQIILLVTTVAANFYLINVNRFACISLLSQGTYLFDLEFLKTFLDMFQNLLNFITEFQFVCGSV